jgi:phosphomannomutase/phosphomannomutase/phosphoglucomutase
MKKLESFKAYDIRGRVPDQLNDELAYRIGRAYAETIKPAGVVVGRDVRLSSESLCGALSRGLLDAGSDVYDIGLCGTEEVYFATFDQQFDGGIMVTASHNPIDYNGMKLVEKEARPISGDKGLRAIHDLVIKNDFPAGPGKGVLRPLSIRERYIEHLLGYIDSASLQPLKVVVNPGNGGAGPVVDLLEERLPFEFIKIHHEPDGSFPHGIPNPLLPENRQATTTAVLKHGADIGIAWDGDFDRCFLFDDRGSFIEGYYIVGLLAEAMLQHNPGARIIHDPRLTWNTIDVVRAAGGEPVQSKTGHAFIKERMRLEDAIYGGEMSAHHYFKNFSYCDSGMIPWLLVVELMSQTGKSLAELVGAMMERYPASGEINRRLNDSRAVLQAIEQQFSSQAIEVDYTDGLSMTFDQWRFNLRASNTEPLLRLNVEARRNKKLMQDKTAELLDLIDGFE